MGLLRWGRDLRRGDADEEKQQELRECFENTDKTRTVDRFTDNG